MNTVKLVFKDKDKLTLLKALELSLKCKSNVEIYKNEMVVTIRECDTPKTLYLAEKMIELGADKIEIITEHNMTPFCSKR